MRLLILPRSARKGPSSRVRHYQFADALAQAGFAVDIEPLLPDSYLDTLYHGRRWPLSQVAAAYLRRIRVLMTAGRYDLIWIEKEILPYFPAAAERIFSAMNIRYVVDYDDNWSLRYRNHALAPVRIVLRRKIETVMRHAALITAGNATLAAIARANNARRVEEIPTVLDPERYRLAIHRDKRPARIVWIGSSLNSRYLTQIAAELAEVCQDGRAEVVVIGGHPVELPGVPVRFESWSEDREVDDLAAADIGIMPLPDDEWERGKCAYKLLQYMAAGLPVVASPVGMNRALVTDDVGFLVSDREGWAGALGQLISDPDRRARMGRAGRAKVERDFSIRSWAPRVASLLSEVARHPRHG